MDTPVKRNISKAILLAVASSQLSAIGYTPSDQVLTIQFPAKGERPGGVYQYAGVKQETFDAFNAAESKGSFFGEHIKGRDRLNPPYPYTLLTADEVAEHITLPVVVEPETGGTNVARALDPLPRHDNPNPDTSPSAEKIAA